jgi:tripartite-type tricarboxylate transporter receptor subunit TctC
MSTITSRVCVVAAAVAMTATGLNVQAQTYPSKPVRVVVPYPPGGTTDIQARLLMKHVAERLGQPFLVENRPGAAGSVGAEYVSRAAPDGYTLLWFATQIVTNQLIQKNVRYDVRKSFDPIARPTVIPQVLVVSNQFPAKNVRELLDLVRSNPNKYNTGTSGVGSAQHLATELFMQQTGARMTHIPYQGDKATTLALITNDVQVVISAAPSAIPSVKSGQMRAFAVTTLSPIPALPDTPTLDQAGVPGFEFYGWQGLFAPAGTPPEIVRKVSAEVEGAMQIPAVGERLQEFGAEAAYLGPAKFKEFVVQEFDKWKKVIEISGIKFE